MAAAGRRAQPIECIIDPFFYLIENVRNTQKMVHIITNLLVTVNDQVIQPSSSVPPLPQTLRVKVRTRVNARV